MSRLIKCPGCIACTVPADRAPVCDGSGFLRDRRDGDDLLAEAVELLNNAYDEIGCGLISNHVKVFLEKVK